jgi:hypothetical protein
LPNVALLSVYFLVCVPYPKIKILSYDMQALTK